MLIRSRLPIVAVAAAVLALFVVRPATACQIPVFRYALERWEASAYELVVFHKGPLTKEHQAIVDKLGKFGVEGEAHANIELRALDVDKPLNRHYDALLKLQKDAPLPRLIVRYPDSEPNDVPVWAGALDAEVIKALIDSPLRRQVSERILAGESAVWLLVESGEKSADEPAYKSLLDGIKKSQGKLELPDLTDPTGPQLKSTLPVKLEFSAVRMARSDPKEKMFLEMLRNIDKQAAEAKTPMVYVIFGRGRALGPLVGKDINEKVIHEVASFIIGECSCQVKEQNPGFDLLMSADWSAVVDGREVERPELPSLTPLAKEPTTRKSN